jgi:hypothetical protein
MLAGITGASVAHTDENVDVATDDARARWVVTVAAYAHGWEPAEQDVSRIRLQPTTP